MVYLSRTAASRREDLGVKQVFNRDTRVAWRARYGRVRAQKEAPRATLSHKAMAERPIAGPWTIAALGVNSSHDECNLGRTPLFLGF